MNNSSQNRVIGLIGQAGSGKTTVLKLLEKMGAFAIDADVVARQLLLQGAPGHAELVRVFGEQVLDRFGEIDRSSLDQLLRRDPFALESFKAVIYPLTKQSVSDQITAANHSVTVLKAVSLSQLGLHDLCDQIWGTTAPFEVQVTNLVWRYGWSDEQAEQHLREQPRLNDELNQADVVISHTGSRADLIRQVSRALQKLLPEYGLQARPAPVTKRAAGEQYEVGSTSERLPHKSSVAPGPSPIAASRSVSSQPLPLLTSSQDRPSILPILRYLRLTGRRLFSVVTTLLAIAYLTSWGLILAERGREHLPAQPVQAAWQALLRLVSYFSAHPGTYYWHKENVAAFRVVAETLKTSAGLLLLALGVALLVGLTLGIAAALTKRRTSSALVMLFSVLGISTPSFLFAMLLWVVNIWVHRTFDITVLPSAGFGWDAHLIMPTLVLAMRPLAQIAQVTYVSMREVLQQDYIRTAYSKGLNWRLVRNVHAIPNILIPTLTTLGSSLRYSLASLPVVEVFFAWPGVGLMLLDAINQGNAALVTDLILSLGLFFLIVNLLIEFSFPLIDARLRSEGDPESREAADSIFDSLRNIGASLSTWLGDLFKSAGKRTESLPPLPHGLNLLQGEKERPAIHHRRWLLRNFFGNPAFIIGTLLLVALLGEVLFGEQLVPVNPYKVHGVMMIEGEIGSPPYPPSATFPWGTDQIGRDIQALVLAGGKRTLTLAFFGMLARVLLGATLGILAGWQRGGWFDRLVTNAVGVWAAFPLTLFAMIMIQALGIQQGMWVFVVAISVVGWGEVAQFVRGKVISLKPQLFIESARSVGSRPDQILTRHIFPNLVNSLIVLAALEMGGILMLLAELGYLNIFMGGGFRVMLGEGANMVPNVTFFSDVPEWAALIANVRQYWRSYPWMALYPGLAVFLSIMTFNLFGEGLRRFLEDTYSNLSRLINRYTFIAATGLVVVISLVLRSSLPLSVYRPEGLKFESERVMQDIANLSSLQMGGRETGTPGANMAAIYLAYRMAETGILPAGIKQTYLQHLVQPRLHLLETPTLEILDDTGEPLQEFSYHRDFVEIARFAGSNGEAQAQVMGAAYGPTLDAGLSDEYGLSNSEAVDRILIVRAGDMYKVNTLPIEGVLVIADESYPLERREVYPYRLMRRENFRPFLLITPQLADSLLRSAGSSLAELDTWRETLQPGEMKLTEAGTQLSMSLLPQNADDFLKEEYINIIGVIPGQGHFMGVEEQVIIVSAYYDGLGADPSGKIYPGANDNASGVAMMLELARLLKESAYQPDKTVLFVAWAGGERQEGLSIVNVLNARPGASQLTVETVIELSGVGYGTGVSMAIGDDSSYRLVKLFQSAAARYNLTATTRGRNPHYGLPLPTAYGGREAATLSLSWDGSDHLAHTPGDTVGIIDPNKLYDIGRSTYLTLLILSRETEY